MWYKCYLTKSVGQRTADSEQWTADSEQWTVDSGLRTADSGLRTARTYIVQKNSDSWAPVGRGRLTKLESVHRMCIFFSILERARMPSRHIRYAHTCR